MRTHQLKTWPEPFQAVVDGRKKHEVRVDDRGFSVGDILILCEWDPSPCRSGLPHGYTGKDCRAKVTYITPGGRFGLPGDLVVMSIEWAGQEER